MLERINKRKSWTFKRQNGSSITFNLDYLVDYMLSTGNFSDPETRLPFTDEDLEDIDKAAKRLKLQRASVLEAKRTRGQAYADANFRSNALLGLERCAGEVISEILHIVEAGDELDPEEVQIEVLQRLPVFSGYFKQITAVDKDFGRHCGSQFSSFLRGPPNSPSYDPYGLIEVVCDFINHCLTHDSL